MKALTIRHPWAELTRMAEKTTENRSRVTHYRGEIAIHAAKQHDQNALTTTHLMVGNETPLTAGSALSRTRSLRLAIVNVEGLDLTYGAIIAMAELADCHTAADCTGCSAWAMTHGGYHWQLANIRPLTPIPAKGALGLWTLPYEIEQAVRGQLAGDLTWGEMVQDFSRAFNPRGGPPTRTPDHPNATPTGDPT